jgi:allantoate deiminase
MIRVERILADITTIAAITQTPGHGATRPTFSTEWGRARDYVIEQASEAGCEVEVDAFGNVHARQSSLGWDTPAWLCGSHIDTVPHGGDYDGVAGVVTALELLRSADDDGMTLPLELIIFAEEEGPTFGLGMLGSRALVGELNEAKLQSLKNAAGQNYFEAGEPFGVDASGFERDRFDPKAYLGLIELHIEQGPGMWRRDQRLAVVTSIAGRQQWKVTIVGEANHAGATSMDDRSDALAAAAEIVHVLEKDVAAISDKAVVTVGRMTVRPNAINVIPNRVTFTIDFRAPDDRALAMGDAWIFSLLGGTGEHRSVYVKKKVTESAPARPMADALVAALRRSAATTGFGEIPTTVSGALHDSAVLAPHLPTVMLFVPSRDGISHNPAEFSRVEDIAAGVRVIEQLVRRPTLAMLNEMDGEEFVAAIGATYEHSPWIAERAFASSPFESIDALAKAMSGVVQRATREEQLGLIRAHPDLVGRLAKEGKLTRESTVEQSAAGLASLTDAEVTSFEQYNAAYRSRFGFPFVICARENKKEAIVAAFPKRLQNTLDQEIVSALAEIDKIALLRLSDAVYDAGAATV